MLCLSPFPEVSLCIVMSNMQEYLLNALSLFYILIRNEALAQVGYRTAYGPNRRQEIIFPRYAARHYK